MEEQEGDSGREGEEEGRRVDGRREVRRGKGIEEMVWRKEEGKEGDRRRKPETEGEEGRGEKWRGWKRRGKAGKWKGKGRKWKGKGPNLMFEFGPMVYSSTLNFNSIGISHT